ncbi:hypothetical protein [Latilactobacillus curvatus]|uniref:hypothetical protein n=1 Tax=Latilactobacillus curvatus TaxID=28038 RepID=UPI00240F69CB|nr:hypothetical protein [Latilactobacillus curvatus]MDG2982027.1 hypothetical protein [Latilactobacillus curvatus]MDT3394788.1 hypothetical protein [Bacillota bacterium]
MNIKQLLKNFSYTISSNLLSLVVSTLVVLIVPKLIGIQDYGYWQLYLFFTTYVGIFHLGWFDGIYLRYGGEYYDRLDKAKFNSQFILSTILELTLAMGIISISFLIRDNNKSYIIFMTAITMILTNMGQFFLYILQITNQIRRYASYTILGRLFYFILIVVILLLGIRSYKVLILADILSRIISLGYGVYCCRDMVFTRIRLETSNFKEAYLNITIGIKLLVANFASNLVIGVIRFGIQRFWGVSIFGKISLTLSISNLLMTFISAVSLVLFPTLRRIKTDVTRIYTDLRIILITLLLLGLIVYFPIQLVLPVWLPKYKDSLVYMAILFPMCLFDGKFEILINTFMKTLRLEKQLLILNIFSVLFSAILTLINVYIFKNLTFMMFSIVLVLGVRSTIGELILWKYLRINEIKQLLLEILIVSYFICVTWYLDLGVAFILYISVLIIYIVSHAKKIKKAISEFKSIN